MHRHEIRSLSQAYAYLLDCQLATLSSMAMKKRRPVYEYSRQIEICELGIQHVRSFGVDVTGTRAADILEADISVAAWAQQYHPE